RREKTMSQSAQQEQLLHADAEHLRLDTIIRLHELYWHALRPAAGSPSANEPFGPIARQIEASFGSVSFFRAMLEQLAEPPARTGWAVLAWSPALYQLSLQYSDTRLPAG